MGDWQNFVDREFKESYMDELMGFLDRAYSQKEIYPEATDMFLAFELTPFSELKVVILGQDPYPNPGQAHGLAFSVPENCRPLPRSLKNIFKESGQPERRLGDLSGWARQGVLLLNTCLTVERGRPASHVNKGWEIFTDKVIAKCDKETKKPIIFVLWGNHAKRKNELINDRRNIILTAAHPSPLSAHNGFFGCNHFNLINAHLKRLGEKPIDWEE